MNEPAKKLPQVRPVFRFLAALLFFSLATGTVVRLILAVSARSFSWDLLIDLILWAGCSLTCFEIWRSGR